MKKLYLIRATMAYFLFCIVYGITILSGNDLMANVVTILATGMTGVGLLFVKSHAARFKANWLILAFVAFSWAIGDTGWFITENILKLDPETNVPLMYIYTLPNIFLVFVTVRYVIYEKYRWDTTQMITDFAGTLLVVLGFFWVVFFSGHFKEQILFDHEFFTSAIYVATDIFVISFITAVIFSSKFKKITMVLMYLIGSILIYAITDIIYVIQVYQGYYDSNQIVDYLYFVAILSFGLSGFISLYRPTEATMHQMIVLPENTGGYRNGIFLMLLPLVGYLIQPYHYQEAIFFVGVIVAHQSLSIYLQKAIQKEFALKTIRVANEELEVKINKRTLDLKEANRQLEKLVKRDSITNLYNRRFFLDYLTETFSGLEEDERVYLFILDIERFKMTNDLYGHTVGDLLLVEFAKRLSQFKHGDMVLSRLGGDEFAFAWKTKQNKEAAEQRAIEMINVCEEPVQINPYSLQISIRIGVAFSPDDAVDANTLLKHADIALYKAKRKAESHYAFFDTMASDQVKRRHLIEMTLKKAKYSHEFKLFYQPQFDISGTKLLGMEALLRWESPEIGNIPPDEFIPVAEETGMIIGIGNWVLNEAFTQIKQWNEHYQKQFTMGINISPLQIDGMRFLDKLNKLFDHFKIPSEWIDLEVTESSAMVGDTIIEEVFTTLSGLGVQIAIDDFGTGYSSLSYIKRFNIDIIKIDKSLIDAIAMDHIDQQIIKAIIMMAKAMELKTIAEGVEDQQQLAILKELGCDGIQGYIYGKPVPANEFESKYLS